MTAPHPAPNPPAAPEPAWGGAPGPGPARKNRAKWIAGGTAAVLIAGGGGAIWAATSSTSSTAAGPAAPAGSPAGQGGPGGPGLGSVLHGEFATSSGSKFTQTGEVTALSATSLTAKSTDGFTKVYVIDSATATGIKTGEDVTIVATVNGDTATATSVTEAGTPPAGAGPNAG